MASSSADDSDLQASANEGEEAGLRMLVQLESDEEDTNAIQEQEDLELTILRASKRQRTVHVQKRRQVTKATEEPKHPAAGVKQDLEKFLRSFLEQGTARFSAFAELWRQQQLSFIYYGRRRVEDLVDFVESLFYQLVTYSQPPNQLLIRIGAIYFMYGYYSQISNLINVHLRLTLEQWTKLTELEDILVGEQHVDAVFCFRQLVAWKAFYICVAPQPFYPNVPPLECMDDLSGILIDKDLISDTDVMNSEKLEMLKSIHYQYQHMKSALEHLPSLSILEDSSLSRLEKVIEKVETLRQEVYQPLGEEDDVGQTNKSIQNPVKEEIILPSASENDRSTAATESHVSPQDAAEIVSVRSRIRAKASMGFKEPPPSSVRTGRRTKTTPLRKSLRSVIKSPDYKN